jgi:hypothetical protein
MIDRTGGLSWLVYRDFFGDINLYGTEASNNDPNVPKEEKGHQYRRYRDVLRQNGCKWCTLFVLFWTDQYGEDWVNSNGDSTGIAEGYVGEQRDLVHSNSIEPPG